MGRKLLYALDSIGKYPLELNYAMNLPATDRLKRRLRMAKKYGFVREIPAVQNTHRAYVLTPEGMAFTDNLAMRGIE